ncbi:hypothetical protein AAGW05_00660 [Arthrobacter sp. LAPM80]|uniref:hypothetical protein n=1 Tax=Arthrobacter sp. LAPM80 TaxID=3141788 RepID=UPI00398B58F3
MKKIWTSSVLFIAGAFLVSGCTIADTSSQASVDASPPASPVDVSYPKPAAAVDTELTITILDGNAMEVSTRELYCTGVTAVAGTNFVGGDAACAVVQDSQSILHSEPKPEDSKVCTGTGNQNIADVFGISNGKHVRVSFMRNNVCNVKTWDKVTPLIGTGA